MTHPIDLQALKALSDCRRNVPVNIAPQTEYRRDYLNQRLPQLAEYDLVERVGPAQDTGLYAITPKGLAAIELWDSRNRDDFEQLVESLARWISIQPPSADMHFDRSS